MDALKNNFSCDSFCEKILEIFKIFKRSPHTTIAIKKCKSAET